MTIPEAEKAICKRVYEVIRQYADQPRIVDRSIDGPSYIWEDLISDLEDELPFCEEECLHE